MQLLFFVKIKELSNKSTDRLYKGILEQFSNSLRHKSVRTKWTRKPRTSYFEKKQVEDQNLT